MSIASLLQRVTGRQKKREQQRRDDYRLTVRQIAEGQEPSPEEVESLLHGTGKTVDELAADVEVMTRRLNWREAYDKLPAYRAEYESMQKQIAECDKALKAAEEKHDKETDPLYGRMSDAKRGMNEADDARRQLSDTCLDEDLLSELRENGARLSAAHQRRTFLESEIGILRARTKSELDEVPHAIFPMRVKQLQERAELWKAKADAMEPELAQARETIAGLEKREKELRERLLVP